MKVNAVIFDLDGTLTKPYLDFDIIREEIGNISGPILEALEKMPPDEKMQARVILERFEDQAAANSELNPGAVELMQWLKAQSIAVGLATRNSRVNVERFCRRHNMIFDCVITRDDGPVKPDPFAVREICKNINVSPQNSVMVGDYLFDVLCGRKAGARTILIRTNKDHETFACEADHVIEHLMELPSLIDNGN